MHHALLIVSQPVAARKFRPLSRTEACSSSLALSQFATHEAPRSEMSSPDALMPATPDSKRQRQAPRSSTTIGEETHTPAAARSAPGASSLPPLDRSSPAALTVERMFGGPRSYADVGKNTDDRRGEHGAAGAARAVHTSHDQSFDPDQSEEDQEEGKEDVVRAPPGVAPAFDKSMTMGVRGRASFWTAVRQWGASQGLPFSTACHRLMSEALHAYAYAAMTVTDQLTHEGKPWRVLIRERRSRLMSR